MRAISAFLVFAVLGGALVAGPTQARPLDVVKSAGVLRVTVYRDYRPWSWQEDGRLKGIDVEIGAALAKALGLKVDYLVLRPDDNLNDDLRNGVWRGSILGEAPGDVMLHVPNDPRVEEANDKIKLTAPYQTEGYAMAVDPANAAEAQDFSLFEREKVAVDIGTLADIILLSARDHKLINNVVHVRGEGKAAQAYEKGEVVAFYGESALVEHLAHTSTRAVTIIHPQHKLARTIAIGGAVKADSVDLGDEIDRQMTALADSGELKRIFASYGVEWRQPARDR
ncbi:transporter substrate-binding domain-containing protein [Rhodoblastus acidophilus]|uniref:Transporter substrate-binding domain-containing protein n=1 Tax=Rhodoblastus acidophilus TaxID=1074 RepID=A0A6N8DQ32_RHOAC|nr:ABC transporter substrate-binding protein [Rhodoblastus acidophilus]MCW2275015.1 ABC-type amino acid transport substrate-binding protein [Rhodoblastus acidophilus]MTV31291.1 transporter substrate-binding domain-containing protein [Rhodoblastus acidophilus]